ncbi:MAG: transketolase [Polyangiaceae bacterium]
MPEIDAKILELSVNTIKCLSIDGVEKAKSGHPGTPMGLADIAFEVWTRYLRHDPKDPEWIGRDRFVLSVGHASMLLYSMLHLSGYDLPMSELQAFRQWGSKTPGHPENHVTKGVETTTGPLGQGIGNAVGMALAARMAQGRFGDPYKDSRVFCLAGDGDIMEGVSAEASSLAGHLGLSNLVLVYDDNRITIEGDTNLAFSEDVGKRYEAYGFFVQHINGHDHVQIRAALDKALAQTAKPSFIVARTHIAQGAPNAVDTHGAHGAPLGKDEIAATKKGMGWDPDKSFYVPAEVTAFFKSRAQELATEHAAWDVKYKAWRSANPELATALDATLAKKTPDDLFEQLVKAGPEKDDATRNTSNAIQQTVAKLVPALVGGSADLGPSTKTLIKGTSSVAAGSFEGRNLHFGIREHAMGSIVNGMALFGGFIPYGSTFLIFSEYMRPPIRLAALMGAQSLFVFTHDSIMLGEDGPTHQPIEQLWSLRLIPNLQVVRPADTFEVAAAWTLALQEKHGPTAFSLSRQTLPNIKRDPSFDPRSALEGMYIVQEASGGTPDLVIIASGSELHLAVGAKEKLEKAGRKVRVVSALCLERFEKANAAYRQHVLPKGVGRVSIEAGRTTPWRAWVGEDGLTIGIDTFGASAPDKVLAEKYGLTVDAVTTKILTWIAS